MTTQPLHPKTKGLAEAAFATRLRVVQDASCSFPQTLKSLEHLVGVATARFQAQAETLSECATDLRLLDAQLGELLHRRARDLDPADMKFFIRAGVILRQLEQRLQGAAR